METKSGAIGVVIGRFQVHELHTAHIDLIKTVQSKHENVIIFLGVAASAPERKNSLNYRSRELMMHEVFGSAVTVLPITDKEENADWSKQLDGKIAEIYPGRKAVLYGSRDSFRPSYVGKHPTVELESTTMVSGTEIRKNVSDQYLSDSKFRAGIINAMHNQYDKVYPTVDVAIYNQLENLFLFGRKPNQQKMRFIGGFVDPADTNYEAAGVREVREETSCTVDGLEYVGSFKVDDWRYRRVADKIMTTFFLGYFVQGPVAPDDDIAELFWKKLDDVTEEMFVKEHLPLLRKLKDFMKLKEHMKNLEKNSKPQLEVVND